MSKSEALNWTDENGDNWRIEMELGNQYDTFTEWAVDVRHGSDPVCSLTVTTPSPAYPPKLRDVAESMAHYFCSVALKMVEAG